MIRGSLRPDDLPLKHRITGIVDWPVKGSLEGEMRERAHESVRYRAQKPGKKIHQLRNLLVLLAFLLSIHVACPLLNLNGLLNIDAIRIES